MSCPLCPSSPSIYQLLPRYLATKEVLVKELLAVGTRQAAVIRDTRGLDEQCLGDEYCLLVLKGNKYVLMGLLLRLVVVVVVVVVTF